jgi:hypothetical protein
MEHKVTFKITGLGPLLMNNPESMGGGPGKPKAKKIPLPKDEADAKVYKARNGKKDQLYLPAAAFRGALIGGCKGKKMGKVGAAGQVMAGVFTVDKKCFLCRPKTKKPIADYDQIHTCRAVVVKAGVLRSRPEILQWACDFTVTVDDDFIDVKQVLELLNLGGKIAGVGDFRIEKKGEHGRFAATIV